MLSVGAPVALPYPTWAPPSMIPRANETPITTHGKVHIPVMYWRQLPVPHETCSPVGRLAIASRRFVATRASLTGTDSSLVQNLLASSVGLVTAKLQIHLRPYVPMVGVKNWSD